MKKFIITALFVFAATVLNAQVKVDKDLETYKSVSGVSGTLNSVGSDTLNNLMANWSEAFKKIYPNVKIEVEGKGSSTAPPALIEGVSQLGPMSREMKSTEVDKFVSKFGYKPTQVRVSIDALAVFVHKDNPIKGLSLQQIDSIFSKTYNFGGKNITTWGQLGLTGEWANKPISVRDTPSSRNHAGTSCNNTYRGIPEASPVKTQINMRRLNSALRIVSVI